MKLFLQVLVIACFIFSSFKKESNEGYIKYRDDFNKMNVSIHELSFLSGNWKGMWHGGDIEQSWTKPMAGNMICVFRNVQSNKAVCYQTIIIEQSAQGPVL